MKPRPVQEPPSDVLYRLLILGPNSFGIRATSPVVMFTTYASLKRNRLSSYPCLQHGYTNPETSWSGLRPNVVDVQGCLPSRWVISQAICFFEPHQVGKVIPHSSVAVIHESVLRWYQPSPRIPVLTSESAMHGEMWVIRVFTRRVPALLLPCPWNAVSLRLSGQLIKRCNEHAIDVVEFQLRSCEVCQCPVPNRTVAINWTWLCD